MKHTTIDKPIAEFIKSQTAFTMATCAENIPSCASCFYAFLETHNALVFKSDRVTKHILEALQNKHVAGTILPYKSEAGKIKGIQFSGLFTELNTDLLAEAKIAYYKKYPFAITFKGELWLIKLTSVKFTDSTLGFGKKIVWEKVTVPPF